MNVFEREKRTKEIFLGIFKEEGIPEAELKNFILESYVVQGYDYKTFEDIPISEMEEAIMDTCEAAGLKFNNFDDILEYFDKQ